MIYIGLPSNPQFLGLQPLDDVATVIATSEGPSGRNDEYLFMLEEGLERLGGGDGHVRALSERVRRLVGERGWEEVMRGGGGAAAAAAAVDEEVEKT